ncbi:TadE/TadG family type IV pilus assembly protein [Virgibacillus sp. Bac332]|uniref:TadE/TadG family type IV pilus assembly protein n=1 Tax=Virgibacillus sp. Bac332 TaxID=2419842 RepID=UPI0013CF2824|nr:TadE/TadG family type IV pilus assembly protein [Virgibacillus sp. Bac332]
MAIVKRENGSITLEAAMIIPLFLTLILLLTSFVKITIAEMALKESVSETAQTVAHYSYLTLTVQNVIDQKKDAFIDSIADGAANKAGNNIIAQELMSKLAESAKGAIPSSSKLLEAVDESVYKEVVTEKYKQKVGSSSFYNANGIKIVGANVPVSTDKDGAMAKVEAEVELNLVIPFFEKTVKIKKKATERGWVGN